MYKIRKNYGANPATFGGMLDTIFSQNWESVFGDNKTNVSVPVNIKDTGVAFQLDVIAPGLKKEDFHISIDKDLLTISFEQKEENKEEKENFIRNEYKFRSFKRSFTLGDKVNADGITAKYADGILSLDLPKKETKEETTKKIEIA